MLWRLHWGGLSVVTLAIKGPLENVCEEKGISSVNFMQQRTSANKSTWKKIQKPPPLDTKISAGPTLIPMLLVANLAKNLCKNTEPLVHGSSRESTQPELSNKYQHDRVKMFFINLCVLVRSLDKTTVIYLLNWMHHWYLEHYRV